MGARVGARVGAQVGAQVGDGPSSQVGLTSLVSFFRTGHMLLVVVFCLVCSLVCLGF